MGSVYDSGFPENNFEIDPHFADVENSSRQSLECEAHTDSLTGLDKWTFAVLWALAAIIVVVLVAGFTIYVV